ncbi:hypothetical protein Taro_028724 [Colocasia esculenta]|uniref:Uncharacterized protein n=1 Tax=Colocasia esculenta TaxID=4460 RepID=A0A843VC09_COLES|nr:hypothetical protein [Colocasia esculenta]
MYSLVTSTDMVFASMVDDSIFAWKVAIDDTTGGAGLYFRLADSLDGHTSAVVSLVVGYPECIHTVFSAHDDMVASVLYWDSFLLSGSLDGSIKVWAVVGKEGVDCGDVGGLREVYVMRHQEGQGVLLLNGVYDAEGKDVLMCSLRDNTVCFYDLPSFSERGSIAAKGEVRTIHSEEDRSDESSAEDESSNDCEDEEAMLSRKLQLILAKKKKFQSGRRHFNKNKDFKKPDGKDQKKGELICYECKNVGGYGAAFLTAEEQARFTSVKAKLCGHKIEEDGTLTSLVKGIQIRITRDLLASLFEVSTSGRSGVHSVDTKVKGLGIIGLESLCQGVQLSPYCISDLMYWAIQNQEINTAELIIERMKFASVVGDTGAVEGETILGEAQDDLEPVAEAAAVSEAAAAVVAPEFVLSEVPLPSSQVYTEDVSVAEESQGVTAVASGHTKIHSEVLPVQEEEEAAAATQTEVAMESVHAEEEVEVEKGSETQGEGNENPLENQFREGETASSSDSEDDQDQQPPMDKAQEKGKAAEIPDIHLLADTPYQRQMRQRVIINLKPVIERQLEPKLLLLLHLLLLKEVKKMFQGHQSQMSRCQGLQGKQKSVVQGQLSKCKGLQGQLRR